MKIHCCGDFTVSCKAWVQALKTVLAGAQFRLIPVVHAAKPEEPPKKPPKMKYKELPVYSHPHYDYKEYMASKDRNPEVNTKLLQKALFPYVRSLRRQSANTFFAAKCTIFSTLKHLYSSVTGSKNDFKKTMRDPKQLQIRQGVVAGGTLTGFLLGGGGGIPRRVFFTSLGALAAGSLCFPKESDVYFRTVAYNTMKVALDFYNMTCRKDFSMRERLPCKDDLPPEPKPRKPVCPPK